MSDGNIIGEVVMKLNLNSEEYSIESSIKEEIQKIVFFLFMIDKIIVDCIDPRAAQAILANAVALVFKEGNVFTEIENVYKRFRQRSSINTPEFEMECKFLSKPINNGEHIYVLTNYKPFFASNINGKMVVLSSLYAMNLRNSFSHEFVEVMDIGIKLLYEEYGMGSVMPKMTTINKAPTAVVNKMFPTK